MMLRERIGLFFSVLVALAPFTSALHESPEVCHTKSSYDVDVFHYFTQHSQHGNLSHLNGALLLTGTDLNVPAFEIGGVGITLSDSDMSHTLTSVACSSHEITLYGSVLFVTNEPGGTLLSLSYAFDEDSAQPFMGLHINRSTNEIVVFYQSATHLRLEMFPYVFQKGRWTKVSVTLTGNLLVIHADCMEVARRKVPLPNYCFGDEDININVGKGMEATELSSTGYSGSVQSVGVWSGRNGLGKQCFGTPDAAQCAMCGHHIKALGHINLLEEEIKALKWKLQDMFETSKDDCTPNANRIQYDSPCFHTNCLIDDVTVTDGDFVYDRSGQICFCRNGAAKCVFQSNIGHLPSISTQSPQIVGNDEAPETPGAYCVYGSMNIPSGETVYNLEVVNLGSTKQCTARTCITIPFPKVVPMTRNCDEYANADCPSLTGDAVHWAQCCGDCDPCDIHKCPEGMFCKASGSMEHECVCPDGYEISFNGTSTICVDRNECLLGTQQGGHNCPANSDCINTDRSFYCVCHSGYSLDNSASIPQCIDIDECLLNICPDHSWCQNTVSHYDCHCNTGYEKVDEDCLPICEEPCENGGFCSAPNTCSCPLGFTGLRCENDIDECALDIDGKLCSGGGQFCVNNHGGYFCRCGPGFQYNAEKAQCYDVPECELYGCAGNAQCVDTWGSFMCICLASTRDCSGDCKGTHGIVKHGHSVVSVKSQCDNCTCKDGEEVCAPLVCNCDDPHVSHKCCPHCNDTSVCVVNDMLLSPGAKYVDPSNRCRVYECQMSNEKAVTKELTIRCPDLGDCPKSKQYTPEGACCPVCASPRCHGDKCTSDTPFECESVSCPVLTCPSEEVLTIPGSCCPICEEQLIEETVYCSTS